MNILVFSDEPPEDLLDILRAGRHQVSMRPLGSASGQPLDLDDGFDLVLIDAADHPEAGLDLLTRLDAHLDRLSLTLMIRVEAGRVAEAIASGADDFLDPGAPPPIVESRFRLAEATVERSRQRSHDLGELEESAASLVALIENIQDYVLFSDRDALPVFFNSAYAQAMKAILDLHMRPGIKPHELLPDPDARQVWEDFHRRVLSGERFTAEYVHEVVPGDHLTFEVSYNPVIKDGEIIGFSEITRDVTEQKAARERLLQIRDELGQKVSERTAELEASNQALQDQIRVREAAEEELRLSRERYRSIFQTAPMAIVAWDRQARITAWNPRAESMFGWAEEEVLGQDMFGFLIPDGVRPRIQEVVNTLLDGEHQGPVVNENLTRAGDRILCEWNNALLTNQQGEVQGVVSLGIDITERRLLETRVRQAEKMEALGQLAGGIAHDFNNQLVGVMGYADLLTHELVDPALRRYAEKIIASAHRSADLISQLLAFARRGQVVLHTVDLHELLHDVGQLLGRSIDKRITLVEQLQADPAQVVGDGAQLHNAILNLALNARDAMPGGGQIRFSTDEVVLDEARCRELAADLVPGSYVHIGVHDDGSGMEPQVRARAFEPFFTTKPEGTGMGLAAVYGTVRSHHGAIEVHSQPGQGTRVDIYLPRASRASDHAEYEVASPGGVPRAHVLVVDDEESVREVACQLLAALGHEVTPCAGGQEALEVFGRGGVDLVLLDLVMPEMNGRQVLARILEMDPEARVVISSGYAVEDGDSAAGLGGARWFLQKPYRAAALERAIERALR